MVARVAQEVKKDGLTSNGQAIRASGVYSSAAMDLLAGGTDMDDVNSRAKDHASDKTPVGC